MEAKIQRDVSKQKKRANRQHRPLDVVRMHAHAVSQEHAPEQDSPVQEVDQTVKELGDSIIEMTKNNTRLEGVTLSNEMYKDVKKYISTIQHIDPDIKKKAINKARNASKKIKEARRRSQASEKGKEAQRLRNASEKGRESTKHYRISDKGKKAKKRYEISDKGKETRKHKYNRCKKIIIEKKLLRRQIEKYIAQHASEINDIEQKIQAQREIPFSHEPSSSNERSLMQQKEFLQQEVNQLLQSLRHDPQIIQLLLTTRKQFPELFGLLSDEAHQQAEGFDEVYKHYQALLEGSSSSAHLQEPVQPSQPLLSSGQLAHRYHELDEEVRFLLEDFLDPQGVQERSALDL